MIASHVLHWSSLEKRHKAVCSWYSESLALENIIDRNLTTVSLSTREGRLVTGLADDMGHQSSS